MKALEYERVHEEHHAEALIVHNPAPSVPIAPLSSIATPAPVVKTKPDDKPMQTVQVGRLSVTVPVDEDSKDQQKVDQKKMDQKKDDQKKDEQDDAGLPECFAD